MKSIAYETMNINKYNKMTEQCKYKNNWKKYV